MNLHNLLVIASIIALLRLISCLFWKHSLAYFWSSELQAAQPYSFGYFSASFTTTLGIANLVSGLCIDNSALRTLLLLTGSIYVVVGWLALNRRAIAGVFGAATFLNCMTMAFVSLGQKPGNGESPILWAYLLLFNGLMLAVYFYYRKRVGEFADRYRIPNMSAGEIFRQIPLEPGASFALMLMPLYVATLSFAIELTPQYQQFQKTMVLGFWTIFCGSMITATIASVPLIVKIGRTRRQLEATSATPKPTRQDFGDQRRNAARSTISTSEKDTVEQIFLLIAKERQGPFTCAAVQQLKNSNRLPPGSMFRYESEPDWKDISELA